MITVRPPVPGDGPQLGCVHARAWRRAYRGLMAPEFLAALDERASGDAWYRRLVARAVAGAEPGVDLLVAEMLADATSTDLGCKRSTRIVGIATVGANRAHTCSQEGELWMIAVTPDAWGTGTGPLLLQAAVGRLAERGFASAVLWVLVGNRRARRFYEREGWSDDAASRIRDLGGAPLAERRYRRSLLPAQAAR